MNFRERITRVKGGVQMAADLVKRLSDLVAEWRREARQLHKRGFDFEATTLDACATELEADLLGASGG